MGARISRAHVPLVTSLPVWGYFTSGHVIFSLPVTWTLTLSFRHATRPSGSQKSALLTPSCLVTWPKCCNLIGREPHLHNFNEMQLDSDWLRPRWATLTTDQIFRFEIPGILWDEFSCWLSELVQGHHVSNFSQKIRNKRKENKWQRVYHLTFFTCFGVAGQLWSWNKRCIRWCRRYSF